MKINKSVWKLIDRYEQSVMIDMYDTMISVKGWRAIFN